MLPGVVRHTFIIFGLFTTPNLCPPLAQNPGDATATSYRKTSCAGGGHNMPLPLLILKVVFESRVTDVGYLCANFSLPSPLCSRVRPNVRHRRHRETSDRQTDIRRQTASLLNAPPRSGQRHKQTTRHVSTRSTATTDSNSRPNGGLFA